MNNKISPRNWNRAVRYGVAPVAVALALACRLALNPILDDASLFVFFIVAIIISGWLGGLGPGLLSMILSTLAIDYFFLPPLGSIGLAGPKEIVQTVSFLILGSVVSVIVVRMQREQRRAEKAADEARANETEARRAEDALREGEQRLRFALETCHIGAWDLDLTEHTANRSLEHDRIFGYAELLPQWTYEMFIEHVLPEDRKAVDSEFRRATESQSDWSFECRIRRADGEVRWIEAAGRPRADMVGDMRRMAGIVQDITERKEAEEALRQSEEARFRGTFENAVIGMTHIDLNGNWLRVNKQFCDLVGYSREELEGKKFWDLTHPNDVGMDVAPYTQLIRGKIDHFDVEKRYITKDGRVIWVYVSRALQRDLEGKPHYSIANYVDITERKRMEDRLRESEERLATFAEATFEGIVQSEAGRLVDCNEQFARLLDYSVSELKGVEIASLVPPEDRERVGTNILLSREAITEHVMLRKDGTRIVVEAHGQPFSPGSARRHTAVRDITERKQAEERLKDSERRLTDIIEFLPDATFALDNAGRIIAWNKAMEELTSAPAMEVLGKGNHEHTYWLYGKRIPCLADAVLKGDIAEWTFSNLIRENEIIKAETYIPLHKPGGVWLSIKVAPIYDARGRIVGVIDACRDITERKRDEEALRQSEAHLQRVLDSLFTFMGVLTLEGVMTYINRPVYETSGLKPEEVIGQPIWEAKWWSHSESASRQVCEATERARRGETVCFDTTAIVAGGRVIDIDFAITPMRDEQGHLTHLIASAVDITERKRIEEAVRESELFFRQTLESIPGMVFTTRPDGYCDYQSQQWVDYTGVPMEEHLGDGWIKLLHPEDRSRAYAAWRDAVEGRAPYDLEYRVRRYDGEYEWFKARGCPIRNAAGEIVRWFGVATNMDELKRAEEALRKSESNFRSLFENALDAFLLTNAGGRIDAANPAACAMFRMTEQEICQRSRDELFDTDDTRLAAAITERNRTGRLINVELTCRRKNGQRFTSEVSSVILPDEELRAFVIIRDITERKRTEEALNRANEQLREADRRKDDFLAMLAHELRNPLAPIRYAVQMLHLNVLAQEQIQKQHEVIDRQVSHMGRLLDDLLEVSRITRGKITLKREIVDLRTVAAHALDSMRPMIEGRGQVLYYEEPSSPLPVDGDPTRLEQIIRNLLHNANKYTEAGGCIQTRLGLETDHEHEWRAVVRVSDSGIGIAPEMLPHVFELFSQAAQSIDRPQGGLGIGLAMVKNLAQMHGGSVEAHSAGLGHGCEFVVRLPLAAEAMSKLIEAAVPEEQYEEAISKSRRVLVVEDNEDAAASLGELLNLWGHEIRTAHDGRHALAVARSWQPEIILLDIGLPGIDGYEVARRLREDPATSRAFLVALTGYGQEEDRRRAREAGFNRHLTKPVELEHLQNILHET